MRKKVGSVPHLNCPLGRMAHDEHTTTMDVVHIPSSGCDRVWQLTRPANDHGGCGRRCNTLKRRPSICLSTSYLLWHASWNPTLDSMANVLFLGHKAMNASLDNVLNITTTHWRIPDSLTNAFKNILPSPIFSFPCRTLDALDP